VSKSIKTDLTSAYESRATAKYDPPKVFLAGDLVIVGDPLWTDSDDWTEKYLGALHVFTVGQGTATLTIVNEKRKGWDSFGRALALVQNLLLSGKTHGAENNVGQIIAIDVRSLQDLLIGCSNK